MTSKAQVELVRLRDLALRDAISAPIEELRQDDSERGIDTAQAAEALRQELRATAAKAMRAARPPMAAAARFQSTRRRPSFDALKAMVQTVFAREPELKLAFREGKNQTEQDWNSLYDDLVDMGAIDPNAD